MAFIVVRLITAKWLNVDTREPLITQNKVSSFTNLALNAAGITELTEEDLPILMVLPSEAFIKCTMILYVETGLMRANFEESEFPIIPISWL